ncbi:FecCD family ABC transporter permease [Staphylococcus intermedius]|uniref:Iron compound ABC transporter, permease protein SirC n=1 Tax=Staphylococcus intermedius NCTC 11048 TaxID=1141106 RepID=A0A380GBD5_STAIN|nr:iron ABC transporter permease [Staphylococcus intermedius]PCF65569.1 iron ABC transporter permease [Staphylococcus intermedius]PCF81248.1 iron ABC transporter permease [Staphylococcus intermedius]PCF82531.1 iron ABC transporter permease [Staphylococcus intermedius]PCF87230.1 iron ABC transporter permease [Staphylococcus intermedius]PNZ54100.1 iron ABC transporter permease [Staphylococcus intermedius NCTC 11048]
MKNERYTKDNIHLCIGLVSIVIVGFLSMMFGSDVIHLTDIIAYFIDPSASPYQFTLEVLRLPRITLAILAGTALGISGLLLQNVLKNPIASPDIIGVTGGASLSAVLFITWFSHLSIHLLPLFAITGGTIAMLILMSFQLNQQIRPSTLIIIGIALQTVLMGITQGLLLTAKQLSAAKAYTWLVGSLYGASFQDSLLLCGALLLMFPLLWVIIPRMKIAALHDSVATGLGLHIQQTRIFQIIVATLLVSVAISFVGNIGFIGLIAPHIAKTLIRTSTFKQFVMTACIGAISLMVADLIGRTLFLPKEVPAGVFIAAFGAPFFIYLLLTVKKL